MEWEYCDSTQEVVSRLRSLGYVILAIEQCEGSTFLDNFAVRPDRRYAIVLGNEVKGVQQEVVDMCDGCIEIPQYGTKHSMNVSVTAGIVMYEMHQKMRSSGNY